MRQDIENEAIKVVTKKITKQYKRVLVGLAHFDNGKKIANCDCCYCFPKKTPHNQKREG